jgi:hypothetical protein
MVEAEPDSAGWTCADRARGAELVDRQAQVLDLVDVEAELSCQRGDC